MRCILSIGFLSLSVTLLGCAGSSPFDDRLYAAPPVNPLPALSETPRELPGEDAPLVFDDQDVLHLDSLIDAVLQRNPTIAMMDAAWQAAKARYPQAISLDDPMLSYAMAPGSLTNSSIRDGHMVDLSQRFPWPGKLRLRGEMVHQEAEAARHDIETVRQRLISETANAYYDYYYAFRATEVNEINLGLLAEFQRIAETKYSAGTAPKQDPLQAEVERYHLEHRAIVLNRMRRVSRARINTLLHRAPELELPPPSQQADAPIPRPDLASLRTRAANSRPELQSLARQLQAKRAQQEIARKEYYPDFTVMGTYNSMWAEPEHQWMIGAGINLPIQIERRRGVEAEALAESMRLAAQLVAGVDRVAFEVSEAYDTLVESEDVVRLYIESFLPVSDENLKAAQSGYESGTNDFLTLINADKNLMLVQLAHQQALTEYHQRWAELERAVGGEIEPSSVAPIPGDHQSDGDTNNE